MDNEDKMFIGALISLAAVGALIGLFVAIDNAQQNSRGRTIVEHFCDAKQIENFTTLYSGEITTKVARDYVTKNCGA